MTVPLVTMRESLERPDLFGNQLAGDSWANWRAVLVAIAGEPLEPGEAAILRSLTGRQRCPLGHVPEFWAICVAAGPAKAAQRPFSRLGWRRASTIAASLPRVSAGSSWC